MAEEQRFDFTAPKHIVEEAKRAASDAVPAQQPSYQRKKRLRTFSPERTDAFNQDDPGSKRSYADIIQEHQQEKERSDTLQKLKRDDRPPDSQPRAKAEGSDHATSASEWDSVPAPRKKPVIWDTPDQVGQDTPTPGRWSADTPSETPRGGSMWDVLPGEQTPSGTPPAPNVYTNVTPQQLQMLRISKEIEARNQPWTDQELNDLLPLDGYEIVPVPEHYHPVKSRTHTPTPFYSLPEDLGKPYDVPGTPASGPGALPQIKPEDLGYFGALLQEVDFDALTLEEQKERRIMEILLKVKNGTPIMRKAALRQITERARELGPGPIFSQILPLMMSTTLEDHERHLLVKVIDRVLFKLDDLVRPYVHKILVVIEPMLIEEDYYARVEGREIVSSLAKAAGLPTMIATMRPDIDHADEYVRNTTASISLHCGLLDSDSSQ